MKWTTKERDPRTGKRVVRYVYNGTVNPAPTTERGRRRNEKRQNRK
jgi:hypothetical protein